MERVVRWEQNTLVGELTQGKELAERLRNNLNFISSPERHQILVGQILLSYEKALSMLTSDSSAFEPKPMGSMVASRPSNVINSPKSEVFDQDFKDQSPTDVYKKRKIQARWTKQVKVYSGTGMEGPVDDGYTWRKYGQKDILGATFPRSYYRCTNRYSQGCLATKLVQRSNQDPTILEVTYKVRHTCFQSSRNLAFPIEDKSIRNEENCEPEKPKAKLNPSKELSFSHENGIKSEGLEITEDIFPSFSFLEASSAYLGNEEEGNDIFKGPMMENDHLLGSLVSPTTTSESNYLSMSPCHYNVRTPESKLVSTSVTNSPIEDWDISMESVDFDALENYELFG